MTAIDPAILLQGPHLNARIDMGLLFLSESMQRRFAIGCAEEILYAFMAPGGGDTLMRALAEAKRLVDYPSDATIETAELHEFCLQIAQSHPSSSKDVAQTIACTVATDASLLTAHKLAQGAHLAWTIQPDVTIRDREVRKKEYKRRYIIEAERFGNLQLARMADHVRMAYQEAQDAATERSYPAILTVKEIALVGATLLRDQVRRYIDDALACRPDEKTMAHLDMFQAELSEKCLEGHWNGDRVRSARSIYARSMLFKKPPVLSKPTPALNDSTQLPVL